METPRPHSRSPWFAFRNLWPWLCAILSGILLTLSFPPADTGGMAFLALTPLLYGVWRSGSRRRQGWYQFGLGYCTGLVFFTTTFWWLGELAGLYHSPFLKTLPFLLSLYLSLYPALWAWLAGWLGRNHFEVTANDKTPPRLLFSSRNLAIAMILAAAWTALEWIRGWLFSGFGWNQIGVALHSEVVLIQIADITGVGGISFLLVMCNVTALLTILRFKAEFGRVKIRPHFDFTLTMALVSLTFAYGIRALMKNPSEKTAEIRIGTIQPNIPQEMKFDPESGGEILARLGHLNHLTSLLSPDLILWPEATIPGGMFGDVEVEKFVRDEAARGDFALLVGTDDMNEEGISHNSAALIRKDRQEVLFYHKMHLVPFGEFLPFRGLLGGMFGDLVPGDFSSGTESGVFQLEKPEIKIAPLVCFEDTQGELTRKPVKDGAQLLVNLTNDGWFAQSCEPYQHFTNSIFRCIETRRPMMRCTNTGVTASVDEFGRATIWSKPFVEAFDVRPLKVPLNPPVTFYTRHGELFSKVCAGGVIFSVLIVLFRRRSRRQKL